MRCPKCGYHSFDYLDSCPKCGADWKGYKQEFNIVFFRPSELNLLESFNTSNAENSPQDIVSNIGDVNLAENQSSLSETEETPITSSSEDLFVESSPVFSEESEEELSLPTGKDGEVPTSFSPEMEAKLSEHLEKASEALLEVEETDEEKEEMPEASFVSKATEEEPSDIKVEPLDLLEPEDEANKSEGVDDLSDLDLDLDLLKEE